MNVASAETRPLALQVGDGELLLVASDVNVLLEAIERSAELESLQEALATPARSLADPPLEITRVRARLLREVLADITGYQRGELTPGLRDLRRVLSEL